MYTYVLFQVSLSYLRKFIMNIEKIESLISKIPDYPKPGILYYDISTMIYDAEAFSACVDYLGNVVKDYNFEKIGAIDARGFIFASALAKKLKKGLTMIRKENKLPGKVKSLSYELEYGSDTLEINQTVKNEKFIVVDDLLATGGTGQTSVKLIQDSGGIVKCFLSLIELTSLNGRKGFKIPVETLIKY